LDTVRRRKVFLNATFRKLVCLRIWGQGRKFDPLCRCGVCHEGGATVSNQTAIRHPRCSKYKAAKAASGKPSSLWVFSRAQLGTERT
jgi:hypothetical protein